MRRALLVVGIGLLVMAGLWVPVAVPRLVRFPADLDVTTSYAGQFTVHLDPASGAPLEEPMTLPLEIDRRVRTLPGGGADTAVLEEAVTYRIAGTEQQERHHYVIDRRSMQHVDDERAWSFSPDNPIDPVGTYRVTLPLGTDADSRYRIWENEPGRSFWMEGDPDRAEARAHGLDLIGLQETWTGAPVAPYYRDELRKQGFALDVPFAQLADQLAADGVDVEQALAALPAADAPVIAAARTAQLPLRFFRDNDGHAFVEPRTGSIVDLVYSEEAITARPDLEPVADLRASLDRASGSPAIAALRDALDEIEAAPPTAVYTLRYEQTDASVVAAAERTRDDLRTLDLVERYVPAGLASVGAVLLLLVGTSWWRDRHRRTEPPTSLPQPAPQQPLAA